MSKNPYIFLVEKLTWDERERDRDREREGGSGDC
jgi:hypothetical protein